MEARPRETPVERRQRKRKAAKAAAEAKTILVTETVTITKTVKEDNSIKASGTGHHQRSHPSKMD
jgi:hypothetical protein